MKAIDHGLVAIGKHAGIADLHLVYTGHRNDFSVIAFVLILVELLALLVAHAGGIRMAIMYRPLENCLSTGVVYP